MFTSRRSLAVMATALVCSSLTACTTDAVDTSAEPGFATAAEFSTILDSTPDETTTSATEEATTSAEDTEEEPAAAETDCSAISEEAALNEALNKLEPYPTSDEPWRAAASGFDPCADLSWMTVTLEAATVSSPYHILLFHQGEYLGTGTFEAYGFSPDIEQVSDSEIAVTYRWPRPGESNAEASGKTYAGFHWDEDLQECVMTGDVPPY